MNKILPVALLSFSAFASAGTYSITCQNSVATKQDGAQYIIKNASFLSDDKQSVLKVDDTENDLPPATYQLGGYMTSATDKNGIKLSVSAVDGTVPHTSALIVSVEDVNGNAIWGLVAGGCSSHKTK